MTEREKLIKAGVRNLREFGYPHCSEANILTDDIYSQFFASRLLDHPGPEAKDLLKEIKKSGGR